MGQVTGPFVVTVSTQETPEDAEHRRWLERKATERDEIMFNRATVATGVLGVFAIGWLVYAAVENSGSGVTLASAVPTAPAWGLLTFLAGAWGGWLTGKSGKKP